MADASDELVPPSSELTRGDLLKIAGRRYRSLTVPEWPLVPALLDAASDTVTGGLSP